MILEVYTQLDTLVRDGTLGVNAQIGAVNTHKGTTCPPVNEILSWDLSKLASEFALPTLQVIWERSFQLEPISQLKWKGKHGLSLNYWTDVKDGRQARTNCMVVAHALRRMLDYFDDPPTGTVLSVMDDQISIIGFPIAGRFLTYLNYSFTAVERDENP